MDNHYSPKQIFGTRRYESLFGRLLPVLDASDVAEERVASSSPDLKVFRLRDVFSEGSVFLGFGRPNVFLGLPRVNGGFDKFDAKSLKRAKSTVINTRGWAQSGLLILLNCTNQQIEQLKNAAKAYTDTKSWTCVNANCKVLSQAGFKSGEQDLTKFYFPMALARQIIRHGLQFKGEKVDIEIVKTTPKYLENFGLSVIKAQCLTLCRHASRTFNKYRNEFIRSQKKPLAKPPLASNQAEISTKPHPHITKNCSNKKNDITFLASEPSLLGVWLTILLGPHTLFQVKSLDIDVNKFLPKKLTAFSAPNPTIATRLKQYLLFSPIVVKFLRSHLMHSNLMIEKYPQHEVFNMLRTYSKESPIKYNIVITGKSISVVRLNVKYPFIDWILSKHVLTSGYSSDVRFAGEMWKDCNGKVYINNNSGTYTPSSNSAQQAAIYLRSIFTEVHFFAQETFAQETIAKPVM